MKYHMSIKWTQAVIGQHMTVGVATHLLSEWEKITNSAISKALHFRQKILNQYV